MRPGALAAKAGSGQATPRPPDTHSVVSRGISPPTSCPSRCLEPLHFRLVSRAQGVNELGLVLLKSPAFPGALLVLGTLLHAGLVLQQPWIDTVIA